MSKKCAECGAVKKYDNGGLCRKCYELLINDRLYPKRRDRK